MQKIVLFVMCVWCPIVMADKAIAADNVMPEGFENIYIGMPLADFVNTRKRIKSGTDIADMIDKGVGAWLNDPNNPRKVDFERQDHKFKENSRHPVFNGRAVYDFSNRVLSSVHWGGSVSGDQKAQATVSVKYVVNKWGEPDDVAVTEDVWADGTRRYVLRLIFWREEVRVNFFIPLEKEKKCHCRTNLCLDEYWCRVSSKFCQASGFELHITTRIGNEGERGYYVGGATHILTGVESDNFLSEVGLDGLLKSKTGRRGKPAEKRL